MKDGRKGKKITLNNKKVRKTQRARGYYFNLLQFNLNKIDKPRAKNL